MLLTERPRSDFDACSTPERRVQIRLLGGARDQELIPLAIGNHSVGSGPKCSVRLRETGVGPMHCLIVRDDEGVRVSRWSSETLLNGRPFKEAPLTGGDCLSIGPIDLEIIAPAHADSLLPPSEPMHEVAGRALGELDEDESPSNDWPHGASDSPSDFVVEVASASVGGIEAPGIGVKILSALESQREQFDELLNRVDGLEQKVELALAEGNDVNPNEMPERAYTVMAPAVDFERDSLFYSEASRERDRSQKADEESAWTQERADLVARSVNLEADLSLAQRQIADALTELGEAQATIDNLQARLADILRAWQELSDERSGWLQQLEELENQLATHTERAEELQDQLRRSELSTDDATQSATTPADPDDVEGEPAGRPGYSSADASDTIHGEAASDFGWTAPTDARRVRATRDDSYDWSVKSADAIVEPEGPSPDEDAIGASGGLPTQTPWTFHDSLDVTADDSVDQAGEVTHFTEPGPAASSIETMPAVEPPIVAKAIAPKRDSESRLSGEIDEALAHLREISLWRRTPESSAEARAETSVADSNHHDATENYLPDSTAAIEPLPILAESQFQDESASSEPAVEPAAELALDASTHDAEPQFTSGSTSFLERNAHMFDEEDHKDEAPASAPALALKDVMGQGLKRDIPATASAATTVATSAAGDADESMEKYMARMMQRIRGDATSGPSSMAPPAAPTESDRGTNPRTANAPVTTNAAANKTVATSTSTSTPNTEPLISLQELKRKEPTPEFATDMGALRALANQSARHAIGVHTTHTLRRNALTRFIICLLASTTTVYFMLNAPDWQSYEFSTGCVSLIAAIYWGRMTFASLVKAVRVGAFDDLGSEFAPVAASTPSLPIDVERRSGGNND
jgi:type III secretion system (T3SS) inner membrane Yop/YscD-like protein